MSNPISNDVHTHTSAINEGTALFNTLHCTTHGGPTYTWQMGLEPLFPSYPLLEGPDQPRDYGGFSSDPFANPGWQYLFQPQIPPSTIIFPAVTAGTDSLSISSESAAAMNNLYTPSQSMSSPSHSSAVVASDPRALNINASTRPEGAGHFPHLGSSIPMVFDEITIPYEKLPLFSCNISSSIGLTLGDALKKNFPRPSVDGIERSAFPYHHCATKLAFWLVFKLGSDFGSWRKQVTVVTTRKGVNQQPSKARLAHLVAREVERYLKECAIKNKPFPYTLDDIVLRRIDLVSKGTLRPRLYIQVRQPRSIRTSSSSIQ